MESGRVLKMDSKRLDRVFTAPQELYRLTGEVLGQGAYASVQTCVNIYTEAEYAVKIIDKVPGHSRSRVFKEIDTFHHCQVAEEITIGLTDSPNEMSFYNYFCLMKIIAQLCLLMLSEYNFCSAVQYGTVYIFQLYRCIYIHENGIVSVSTLEFLIQLCHLQCSGSAQYSVVGLFRIRILSLCQQFYAVELIGPMCI
jgi:MAP kinase interacting serine/threonine kinase